MKKLSLLALMTLPLYATPSLELVPEEGFPVLQKSNPFCPISINGTMLGIAKAELDDFDNQHLIYDQNNIAFGYVQPFNEVWGVIFGAGYVGTEVKWRENPFFEETQFGYVNFSLGAFTKAMPNWNWTLTVTAFADTAVLDFGNYALYQGVIYGEYDITPTVFFDAGFILEAGLSHGKTWPILGVGWEPKCSNFRLYAIYPLDCSIEYDFFDYFTAAVSLRFLRNRHRVLESEPIPMGIFQYESTGAEFDLYYSPWCWVTVQGFAGSTFGGKLRVTDRSNHNAEVMRFKSSFYAGFSAVLNF